MIVKWLLDQIYYIHIWLPVMTLQKIQSVQSEFIVEKRDFLLDSYAYGIVTSKKGEIRAFFSHNDKEEVGAGEWDF